MSARIDYDLEKYQRKGSIEIISVLQAREYFKWNLMPNYPDYMH